MKCMMGNTQVCTQGVKTAWIWYPYAKPIGWTANVLVTKRPAVTRVSQSVSFSLRQHLGNISVAPGLLLLLLLLFWLGCRGLGEQGDAGSLCVGCLFAEGGLYACGQEAAAACRASHGTAWHTGVSWTSSSPGRIPLLRRSQSLHEGGDSDSFLKKH